MKVVVLHGPGEVAKRNQIFRIKAQSGASEVVELDLKQADLSQLQTCLISPSLFAGSKLVVAENPSSSLNLEGLRGDCDVTLVLVSPQLNPAAALLKSALRLGAKIIAFEGEKELSAFPFIDALIEQKKEAFVQLNKLLDEYGGVYVLSMIYYSLRRNFLPLPASAYARKKILAQRERYQLADWPRFYRLALEADFGIKSGLAEERLALTALVQKVLGC